ncbi:MAG TPA: holo-ACP synthase [Candidatus Babeliales bacterium]|jgi:holo-[acyl-carrier protein] synthase|nr:holo-ACP synthase [Candidatus Babeliales bacterium]
MIQAIGIDTVDIERFWHWHTKSVSQLERIFSSEEIAYCLYNKTKSAERFAVRFATKEACAKVISVLLQKPMPLLQICRIFSVTKNRNGVPYLYMQKMILPEYIYTYTWHISLTHSKHTATAVVIVEK